MWWSDICRTLRLLELGLRSHGPYVASTPQIRTGGDPKRPDVRLCLLKRLSLWPISSERTESAALSLAKNVVSRFAESLLIGGSVAIVIPFRKASIPRAGIVRRSGFRWRVTDARVRTALAARRRRTSGLAFFFTISPLWFTSSTSKVTFAATRSGRTRRGSYPWRPKGSYRHRRRPRPACLP